MNFKQLRKNASYFAGWLGLNFCSLTVKIIPGRFLYSFAQGLGKLGYLLAAKQRNIALESLSIALQGEKTIAEQKKIAKECFIFMAKSAIEVITLMDKPKLLKQKISFEGKNYLEDALTRGRGVILVSAHFGNFPLLLARLSLEGFKAGGIMRPMRDSRVEKIFLRKRMRYQVKTIYSQPRTVCVNQTLESLRNNEIVFIPIDQNFGTSGVFVEFFGRKAATATGPVVLAQRARSALIPCFIIRQKDDTHKVVFEPEMQLQEGQDSRQTIELNIQRLTNIIELYIRRYPAEWGWIHRRWKSQMKA